MRMRYLYSGRRRLVMLLLFLLSFAALPTLRFLAVVILRLALRLVRILDRDVGRDGATIGRRCDPGLRRVPVRFVTADGVPKSKMSDYRLIQR